MPARPLSSASTPSWILAAGATALSVGCVLSEAPLQPPRLEPLPLIEGKSVTEWLAANAPDGTPAEEAMTALQSAGLTCEVQDGFVSCFDPTSDPPEGGPRSPILVFTIKDGKVYRTPMLRDYRTHGGII